MRLRSHLLLMTGTILLPVVIFGVASATLIAERERAVFRSGATERTLALLTALDAELAGHVNSLRALANLPSLEQGDYLAFHHEARRTLATQLDWQSIDLALPTGQRVLSTEAPLDASAPPPFDAASLARVARTGRPVVGDLFNAGGRHLFAVHVPVFGDEELEHVLSVQVYPGAIVDLLTAQRLPSDWVGVVLDAQRRIVARTVNAETLLGQPASNSLRAALDAAPEGWFHGATIEGTRVYTPYNRSPSTGWTVALGIPEPAVELAGWRTALYLVAGVSAALVLALAAALMLGRRISAPIGALAARARALGSGAPLAPPEPAGVLEVNEVGQALANAATLVREREDELRAAARAKDEFLAMLGHELRNPLAALASASELLALSASQDPRARDAAAIIARQIQHMTRLVDDLVDVGRVTSGKITLAAEPLNLADLVARLMAASRAAGRLDRHDVRLELSPAWVRADAARVEQILSNLVGNATKYTPPGGRIAVRTFPRDGEAVLEVADTGAGLPAELQPRIFDLFVQGDRSLDRQTGGLGIGLTLVKRLAELHGGSAAAASEGPGRGACFTVRLPAIDEPHPAVPPPRRSPSPQEGGPTGRRRILLIEDNADGRRMMQAVLEALGCETFGAADGAAGLAAAERLRPDAAVIDIGLPELDGYAVARRLRATPEGRAMALIALTGYGDEETRRRAREAGFDEHAVKPASPERLVQLIEETLARHHRPTSPA